MEQPFEITYNSKNTSFVLAVYRSYRGQQQDPYYTIVVDEVSLGDLVKVDHSWKWESGGKEGPNHGGINLDANSAAEIGQGIDNYLSTPQPS